MPRIPKRKDLSMIVPPDFWTIVPWRTEGGKQKILSYYEKGLMNPFECAMIKLSENDYTKEQKFNKFDKKVRK